MTENTAKKEVQVNLDLAPLEARIRSQYEEQLKAKDETIKALLSQEKERLFYEQERKKAENVNNPKPAPIGGDTALYQSNKFKESYPLDVANSDIDPSWIKAKNVPEVIALTEELARKGNKDCQLIIDKLTKKVIRKGINLEFKGSAKDFLRSPLPITDNLPVEEQERRKKVNERLIENRQNWVNLDED